MFYLDVSAGSFGEYTPASTANAQDASARHNVRMHVRRSMIAAALLMACGHQGSTDNRAPGLPSPAITSSGSSASPSPDPNATPTPFPTARQIDLDPAPRAAPEAETVELGEPRCQFGSWDRRTIIVYDLKTCEVIEAGNGIQPVFAPDSAHVAWIERFEADSARPPPGSVAKVMDLATRSVQDLGVGSWLYFDDQNLLRVLDDEQTPIAAFNGAGTPAVPWTPTPFATVTAAAFTNERYLRISRHRLFAEPLGSALPNAYRNIAATPDGAPMFEWQGGWVTEVDESTWIVTSLPEGADADVRGSGTVNLYELDLPAGDLTFLGTVSSDHRVSGDERFIVWSENACFGSAPARTYILARTTRLLRRIDMGFAGAVGDDGMFHGWARSDDGDEVNVVFDPASLEVQRTFPEFVPRTTSPDGRYLAPYIKFGGSGPCGL